MAEETRTTLKGYFEQGDTPTQIQFASLIDSTLNLTDDDADDVPYLNSAYPSIATIKDALDILLYTDLLITSFYNNQTLIEKGASVTETVLYWIINKDVSLLTSCGLTWTGSPMAQDMLGEMTGSTGTYTHTSTYSTDRTYSMTATDGTSTSTKTTTVLFRDSVYWDALTEPTSYTTAWILTLADYTPKDNFLGTYSFNAGSGEYIYFAIPKTLADAHTPYFWIGGFNVTFDKVGGTISHTNDSGGVADYYIYKSGQPNLGVTDVQITYSGA